jgi:hypothetical protein
MILAECPRLQYVGCSDIPFSSATTVLSGKVCAASIGSHATRALIRPGTGPHAHALIGYFQVNAAPSSLYVPSPASSLYRAIASEQPAVKT